jgi:hypothetical protein
MHSTLASTLTVALYLAIQVHAHAGVIPALGVTGTFARSNVQRPSTASPCGTINIAQSIDTSTAVAASGGKAAFTGQNFNG